MLNTEKSSCPSSFQAFNTPLNSWLSLQESSAETYVQFSVFTGLYFALFTDGRLFQAYKTWRTFLYSFNFY